MAAENYYGVVQQLYISYFGRPADYYGRENFAKALDAMGAPTTFEGIEAAVGADAAGTSALSQLVNSFNTSEESVALYGNDNSQIGISKFVAAIYQNVLGRAPEADGFNFWVEAITSGTLSKANAAASIAQAAMVQTTPQGLLDKKAVENKLAVATSFTNALDTPAEWIAYAGNAAAATGRSLISGVNDATNVTAYQTQVDAAVNTIVSGSNAGQAVSLTAGVDTLTGTAGNDTFNALSVKADGTAGNTLTGFDSIDGGAGNDTLNIYTDMTDATAPINGSLPAQATIRNVETINIYNTGGAAAFGDASQFQGATAIWQHVSAAAVTNLGAATTAGFKDVTAATALSVTAADAAATASVALNGVKGNAATTNAVALNVAGAALTGVTVSGTIVKGDTATGSAAAKLNLNVTAGKDVQSVSVNSAVATTLTVANGANSTKALTAIDAAASTGGITYVAAATGAGTAVSSIKTGSGNDTVTITTATAIDNTATTANEAVNATVSTGAGNDTINVNVTGVGMTTIDAGAGADTINVAATAQNVTIMAGEGNDTINFARGVGAKDVIDGGAGTDTLKMTGTALAAQDYEILTVAVKNVENLAFANAVAGVDASKLAQFSQFQFVADGSSIVKVANAQSIVTTADVSVSAAGYVASTTAATGATYAGNLNITATGGVAGTAGTPGSGVVGDPGYVAPVAGTPADPMIVKAYAENVSLTVNAVAATATAGGTASAVSLAGDAKTATVNLVNSVNAGTGSTATADVLANFSLITSSAETANQFTSMGNLTSIKLNGNGAAVINASGTGSKLATIDASGMTGVAAYDATQKVGGLTYTANADVAETITLGGGKDIVTTSSAYTAMDTINGLTLVAGTPNGTTVTLDAAKSDDISVGGVTGFVKTTVTGATLGLALSDAAANTAGNNLVFQYNGDTYAFVDNAVATGTDLNTVGTFGNGDIVVKLTGTVDLDLLVLALNTNAA